MYFVCPRYVFACMSKMSAHENIQLPVCGVWCFVYSWSTCLSPAGETGASGLQVSLCLGMLESLSSVTGELNSPVIILWLIERLLFGQFLPWEAFVSGCIPFPRLYFHSLSALLKKLNLFFFWVSEQFCSNLSCRLTNLE